MERKKKEKSERKKLAMGIKMNENCFGKQDHLLQIFAAGHLDWISNSSMYHFISQEKERRFGTS
jgi:hypothetical protein